MKHKLLEYILEESDFTKCHAIQFSSDTSIHYRTAMVITLSPRINASPT